MDKLIEFGFRTNIDVFSYRGKRIILYRDHRTILNALFFALKESLLQEIPNVIYFDYHDDACTPKKNIRLKSKDFSIANTTKEQFNSIVEFELSPLDDDWVKSGMEFGLIKHSVAIGVVNGHNIDSYDIYTSVEGKKHELFSIGHLKDEMSNRGCLGDSVIVDPYYKRIREIFNYNKKKTDSFDGKPEMFILDFDLDCFTSEFRYRQMAWPEQMFKDEMFTKTGYYDTISPHEFISELIEQAEFITIATEPGCCGGLGEAHKVLSYLDKYFFEGNLSTITYA